jgi:hypothetical protein
MASAFGEFGQRRCDLLHQHLRQALAFARNPVLELVGAGQADAGEKRAVVRRQRRRHIATLHGVGEQLVITGDVGRQRHDRVIARRDPITQGAPKPPQGLSHILPQAVYRCVTPEQLRDSVA